MNWEAISSFAEVVGAGAVVISLIYVGVQLKLNNSLSRANAFQQINFQFAEVASQLSSDAELARIYRIAAEGGDLDPDEAIRYTAYLTSFFAFLENAHIQEQSGLLADFILESEGTIDFMAPHFSKLLQCPAAARWWQEECKNIFSPDFYRRVSEHAGFHSEGEK